MKLSNQPMNYSRILVMRLTTGWRPSLRPMQDCQWEVQPWGKKINASCEAACRSEWDKWVTPWEEVGLSPSGGHAQNAPRWSLPIVQQLWQESESKKLETDAETDVSGAGKRPAASIPETDKLRPTLAVQGNDQLHPSRLARSNTAVHNDGNFRGTAAAARTQQAR